MNRIKRITNRYISKDLCIAIFILGGINPLKVHETITLEDVKRVKEKLRALCVEGGEKA